MLSDEEMAEAVAYAQAEVEFMAWLDEEYARSRAGVVTAGLPAAWRNDVVGCLTLDSRSRRQSLLATVAAIGDRYQNCRGDVCDWLLALADEQALELMAESCGDGKVRRGQ